MKAENRNRKKIEFVTLARFENSQNVKMKVDRAGLPRLDYLCPYLVEHHPILSRICSSVEPHGEARGNFHYARGGILSESPRPRPGLESKGRPDGYLLTNCLVNKVAE